MIKLLLRIDDAISKVRIRSASTRIRVPANWWVILVAGRLWLRRSLDFVLQRYWLSAPTSSTINHLTSQKEYENLLLPEHGPWRGHALDFFSPWIIEKEISKSWPLRQLRPPLMDSLLRPNEEFFWWSSVYTHCGRSAFVRYLQLLFWLLRIRKCSISQN